MMSNVTHFGKRIKDIQEYVQKYAEVLKIFLVF